MSFYLKTKFREAGICGNCQHAFITKDINDKLTVRCNFMGENTTIQRPLKECTEHRTYTDRNSRQLEEMAWLLAPGKSGKIGFTPPKRKKEIHVLEDAD